MNDPRDPIELHNVKTAQAMVLKFSDEIGLSKDEIILLIFASCEFDYFNHLIVCSGEFTKWFNINFSGDSQEEIDFRDNKIEHW